MLKILSITHTYKYIDKVKSLYLHSFPIEERDTIHHLLYPHHKVGMRFLAFENNNSFVGFVYVMKHKNLVNILFFAIDECLRGQGYGSKCLELLKNKYQFKKIILDIERIEDNSLNNGERIKRENFYLNNGFKETNIFYSWHHVDYQILSYNGEVSQLEFDEFWKYFKYDEDMGEYLYNLFKKPNKIK